MTGTQPRKPSGAPVGGQFDRKQGSAPASSLSLAPPKFAMMTWTPTPEQHAALDILDMDAAEAGELAYSKMGRDMRAIVAREVVLPDGSTASYDYSIRCEKRKEADFSGPEEWSDPIAEIEPGERFPAWATPVSYCTEAAGFGFDPNYRAPAFDQAWFADTFPAETARTRECGFNPVEVIRTPSGKSLVTYRLDGAAGSWAPTPVNKLVGSDTEVVVAVFNSGCMPEARVVAANFDGAAPWDEHVSYFKARPGQIDTVAALCGYQGDLFAVEEAVVDLAAAVDAWHLAGSLA